MVFANGRLEEVGLTSFQFVEARASISSTLPIEEGGGGDAVK